MAESKELSKEITKTGLFRVGYQYNASFLDWLAAVFNPISRKKVRFDVISGNRFSFSTADYPAPSVFGVYEKHKTILVDLKAGELLTLKLSGEFQAKRFFFIIDEPGTFKE